MDLHALELLIGGVASGALGALLGIGGGVFIVPLLLLAFDVPIRFAIGASLVAVIATSAVAAAIYFRLGWVDLKLAMTLELATTLGAILGGLVAGLVHPRALEVLFALTLTYTALSMFRRGHAGEGDPEVRHAQPVYRLHRLPMGLGGSLFAGALSGLLGVGGGVVKVPIMHLLMDVPLKVTIATSSFMVGVTAAASAFVYYARGDIQVGVTAPLVLGVLAGALLGSRLSRRIKVLWLRWLFAVVLLFVAYRVGVGR